MRYVRLAVLATHAGPAANENPNRMERMASGEMQKRSQRGLPIVIGLTGLSRMARAVELPWTR